MNGQTHSRSDWKRIALLCTAAIISAGVGYIFQPLISDNTEAISTIVTIFSILAGFLIALITLIAEPALSRAKDWTELQTLKPSIENKLTRQKLLFFLYLFTLGLALAMFLVPEAETQMLLWLERLFLGLAVFVFLVSFALPGSLMKIQMERYDSALESEVPEALRGKEK